MRSRGSRRARAAIVVSVWFMAFCEAGSPSGATHLQQKPRRGARMGPIVAAPAPPGYSIAAASAGGAPPPLGRRMKTRSGIAASVTNIISLKSSR